MSGTNPVATFVLTNFTTMDPATYKAQIDSNSIVAQRVIDQFAPHQAASPNMTVLMDAGSLYSGTTLTEVAQQTSGTITAPSGSNKRIDRAVVNALTGTLSIITGTPTTGTPSPPAFTAGNLPVAQIGTTSSPLLSTTTTITNAMILDERNFWGESTSQLANSPVIASCRNLVIKQASTTTATVAYDEIVAKTALGGTAYLGASGSFTINFATNGANGLDTGSLTASTFYYIYAIYNPSTNTWAALASASSSSPTLPSGYTASALIGVMLSDGSSHLLVTIQYDREVWYQSAITAGSNLANETALTSQSISGAAPALAKTCSGVFTETLVASQAMVLAVAADSTGTGQQSGPAYTGTVAGQTSTVLSFRHLPIITAQTVYYSTGSTAGGPTNTLKITSYTI